MDLSTISDLAKKAVGEKKYLWIDYNGVGRDVFPVSFRYGPGGYRLYATCTLHPQKPIESFLLSNIYNAQVSPNDALLIPSLDLEIEGGAPEPVEDE